MVSTGNIDLTAFYARCAQRILPAATLTVVTVSATSYLWMPEFTCATVAADMVVSAVYAENWARLSRSVDYLAIDQVPSPL